MLPKGITLDEILQQVQAEYQSGYDAVSAKRTLFRERLKLYWNVWEEDKIYVRLIYTTMRTLVALSHKDTPTVKFMGRQIWDDSRAKNLERLKDFDYEEMWLSEKKYWVQRHKYFYWTGIEVSDWYDKVTQTPKVRSISPLSWIPDPNYDPNTWYAFHWFETVANRSALTHANWYFNTWALKTDKEIEVQKYIEMNLAEERWMEDIMNDDYMKNHRKLSTSASNWHWKNTKYSLYQHYTTLSNWKKYILTLANERWLLIRIQEILPVFDEEKKDPSKVEFPVVIRNWSPVPWDPFGISVPDLLEDKQKMKQLFLNLNRIKAENEALWDIFFYDPDIVENIDDIKMPSIWPKFVEADLTRWTPMVEANKSRVKPDAYNMPDILERQWFSDIGIDEASLWFSPTSARTATEHQRVQQNANLRLELWNRINKIAEKKFRKVLRYRMYVQYFNSKSMKIVYINNWVGLVPSELFKNDFITSSDINVKVMWDQESEEIRAKETALYMANLPMILNNPALSQASKNFAQRRVLVLWGMKEETANIVIPEIPEETQAKLDLELLNRNEDVAEVTDMNEDHMAYIIIYWQALDTKAKFKAIEARKKALLLSWQNKTNVAEAIPWSENLQSQMTSNLLAKTNSQSSDTTSLQDIR